MEEINLKIIEGFLLGTGAIIAYNFYTAVNSIITKIIIFLIDRFASKK